jgi:hypothetical protein
VLQRLLAVCDAEVRVNDGWLSFTRREDVWVLDQLETREDGVVVMHLQDCVGAPRILHPEWVVRVHTSCSKGIDFDLLHVWLGERELLDVTQLPGGELSATVKGEVVQRAPFDADVTFDELVARWSPTIAAELGPGHVVLSDRDTAPPHSKRVDGPPPAPREDDDIPF